MNQNKSINIPDTDGSSTSKQAGNKLYIDYSIANVKKKWSSHLLFNANSLKLLKNIDTNNKPITNLASTDNPMKQQTKKM